jgi:hypothetical protein
MMPITILDAGETGKKIFKPHGEEFSLDGDFAAVAAALSLSVDQVAWAVEDDAIDGIDGKSLVGHPAS